MKDSSLSSVLLFSDESTEVSGGVICEIAPGTETETDENSFAHVHNGYGKCSKNYCNCNEFEGTGGTCANSGCGHSFTDHW